MNAVFGTRRQLGLRCTNVHWKKEQKGRLLAGKWIETVINNRKYSVQMNALFGLKDHFYQG